MSTNVLMPRAQVHDWSEEIAANLAEHQTGLQRLLKGQRRLTRFIEQQRDAMAPGTGGVAIYMTGVIARMFDLAGGRLKNATWDQVRAAEAKVRNQFSALLPLDAQMGERFRTLDRAQPHILDEAYMALFESERDEEDEDIDEKESLKILLLCWVVAEVMDSNWTAPSDFAGDSTYEYVHIEPSKRSTDD